jgi:predicted nucleotidyltransferase
MDRNTIIATLRDREAELKALGVVSLSLFGSAARGDATEESDIDVAVTLDPASTPRGFYYAGASMSCANALPLPWAAQWI